MLYIYARLWQLYVDTYANRARVYERFAKTDSICGKNLELEYPLRFELYNGNNSEIGFWTGHKGYSFQFIISELAWWYNKPAHCLHIHLINNYLTKVSCEKCPFIKNISYLYCKNNSVHTISYIWTGTFICAKCKHDNNVTIITDDADETY